MNASCAACSFPIVFGHRKAASCPMCSSVNELVLARPFSLFGLIVFLAIISTLTIVYGRR